MELLSALAFLFILGIPLWLVLLALAFFDKRLKRRAVNEYVQKVEERAATYANEAEIIEQYFRRRYDS